MKPATLVIRIYPFVLVNSPCIHVRSRLCLEYLEHVYITLDCGLIPVHASPPYLCMFPGPTLTGIGFIGLHSWYVAWEGIAVIDRRPKSPVSRFLPHQVSRLRIPALTYVYH